MKVNNHALSDEHVYVSMFGQKLKEVETEKYEQASIVQEAQKVCRGIQKTGCYICVFL